MIQCTHDCGYYVFHSGPEIHAMVSDAVIKTHQCIPLRAAELRREHSGWFDDGVQAAFEREAIERLNRL